MRALAFPALALASLAMLSPLPALGQSQSDAPSAAVFPVEAKAGAPMSAEAFDAYVTGKTLTYSQYGLIYGTEEYLPNRRVRWQVTGDLCQYGHWYEKSGLICFTYEYQQGEHCWSFWQEDGLLRALSTEDLPDEELSEVKDAAIGLTCPDLDVGV